MSDNQWEDYHIKAKADYSCDPYTYYFFWSNFGNKDYSPDGQYRSRFGSGLMFLIGCLIILLII